jgi:hypothetical protein
MNTTDESHRKAVIGTTASFWLYDSRDGFDLTHPKTAASPQLKPRAKIITTTLPITIHPPTSTLVIVDMQNFFLSPCLGRLPNSAGLMAQNQLLEHCIPAAREAGLRIVWLNWGLTDEDLTSMPPSTYRAFGFETVPADDFSVHHSSANNAAAVDSHGVNEIAPEISLAARDSKELSSSGKNPRIYKGLGKNIGSVTTSDGTVVDGGRLLFRDCWNTALTPELDSAYRKGLSATVPDVWINKNR